MPYRNMSLDELAVMLGLDVREVRRLTERGTLPGRMVGGEWRFNSAAMLDWLQREMHSLSPAALQRIERAMSTIPDDHLIESMLPPEAIELQLAARSRASVPRELVRIAAQTGLVYDTDGIRVALEEREALGSTALAGGFAFPHPRTPQPYGSSEPLLVVARSMAGVPYGAPDGQLTYLFVLVLSHDDRTHLHTLARLSLLFGSGVTGELMGADSTDELLARLIAAEQRLLADRDPPR